MKPSVDQLAERLEGVDHRLIQTHLQRLEDEYFEQFNEADVAEHIQRLSRLGRSNPVELIVNWPTDQADPTVEVTVLAMDYPSVFSLIAGVLAGMGYSIESGQVFTYSRDQAAQSRSPGRHRPTIRRRRSVIDPIKRRRIIDQFRGRVQTTDDPKSWARRLDQQLSSAIGKLEQGDEQAQREARHQVNVMVTESLDEQEAGGEQALMPMEIQTEQVGGRTRLEVISQDTPAFLYALSNALSLQGLVIERLDISTTQGRIHDRIDFVDSSGQAVTDQQTLDRVKFIVLLTKQFTYFLESAPDPYTALSRYEQMVSDLLQQAVSSDWFEELSNPRAMSDLARVLGASDFLWEDFIRLQYEALGPIFQHPGEDQTYCQPIQTLPQRLGEAMDAAGSYAEKRKALNRFKDREIFQLDLDHILNPKTNFRALAERLTVLAENVVQAAGDLSYQRLTEQYGVPRDAHGSAAPWAAFGLGKLGGAALGYASDIELMFLYEGSGKTDGSESIATGEFYQLFARELTHCIEAKQEGIFRVDLRLRPYGTNAPLACDVNTFEKYYGPAGDAQAFERMALVRMRAIAGDDQLGQKVTDLRDQLVYEGPEPDRDQLLDMRRMQYRQKRRADQFNAKYSPGGLVDVEYTVQMIQLRHARANPGLRTPRVHQALAAMAEHGVMPADQADRLNRCYDFLRQLINALRMLRGSAKDLFVPTTESDSFTYLARRMGYRRSGRLRPAQQLYIDLQVQTARVRLFVEEYFGRDALPDPAFGNLVDVVLSEHMDQDRRREVLKRIGFANPQDVLEQLVPIRADEQLSDDFADAAMLAIYLLTVRGESAQNLDAMLRRLVRRVMAADDPARFARDLAAAPQRVDQVLSELDGTEQG